MRVLLVEDEPEIADIGARILRGDKYLVDVTTTLAHSKAAIQGADYDLVLLDRMLPDGDGVDLIKFAESKRIVTRFLIVSAMSQTGDLVHGLDLGADDYVRKPFDPVELRARIRATLRRPLPDSAMSWTCGHLAFEQKKSEVSIHGEFVQFSRRELHVIEVLIKAAGRVVTRDVIDASVFGYDDEIQSNTLEAHISRVRKLLVEKNAGVVIHAVRGVGYMMKEG